MINHVLSAQRHPNKYAVLLSIQAKILLSAEFSITNFRVLYRLEKFGSKEIAGKYIPHCRTISIIGQQTIDDCVIKQLIDELELFILEIDGGSLVVAKLYYPVFINHINELCHLFQGEDSLGWGLIVYSKKFFSGTQYVLLEVIFSLNFSENLGDNLLFGLTIEAIPIRILLFQLFSDDELDILVVHKASVVD